MDKLSENSLKNYAYLLKLLSSAINESSPEEPSEDIDFNFIYKAAKEHNILNTVFYSIERLNKKPEENLYKSWETARNKAFHRSLTQRAEFESIKKAFDENGIEYLPVKGFPVSELYPSVEYRFMGDLDILVKDTKTADKIMYGLGYSQRQVGSTNHDELLKPPFMLVELHRDLVRADSRFYDYYENIFERANKLSDTRYELSGEDSYIYGIVHLEKHYAKAGTGIRSFSDLYLINKKLLPSLDKEYIDSELKKLGLFDFRKEMSEIADKWFLLNDFENFGENEIYIFTSGAYGTTEHKVNAVKGDKGKLHFFFRRLFPKPKTMKWVFPWLKKRPYLLPWAYIYRLFRDGIGRRKEAVNEIKALKKVKDGSD